MMSSAWITCMYMRRKRPASSYPLSTSSLTKWMARISLIRPALKVMVFSRSMIAWAEVGVSSMLMGLIWTSRTSGEPPE